MNAEKAKVNRKFLARDVRKNIFVAGMLLIPVVHFIIFYGIVNFNSILMAFQRLDPATGKYFFTTANFQRLVLAWQYGNLKDALISTFLTFGLMIFFLPWGFFLTYFLYKRIPLGGFWRTMLFVPTVLPAIAMTTIFVHMIYPLGPIGSIWTLFGKQAPFFVIGEKYARWTVLVYIFWTNFGGQFILFMGAMSRIPKELIESARIDGAGMWKEMLKIVLPLCWPTFSMLLLLNIAGMFVASGPILLFRGLDSSAITISFKIFDETRAGGHMLGEAAALGVVCTVILFPVVLLLRRLLGKVYADVEF